MRDHDGRETIGNQPPIGGHVVGEVGQVPPVDRQGQVGVRDHGPMGRKVFGGGRHPRIPHAVHIGDRQLAHDRGLGMERPVADDLADPVVQVHAGSEGNVDSMGAQLRRHQPSHVTGELQSGAGVQIELVPDTVGRREPREPGAKALDAPSFVIDRDDQRRGPLRMNCGDQCRKLLRVDIVTCEQDHSANEWMPQQLTLLGGDRRALQIDHQRTQSHPGNLFCPPGVRTTIDSTCAVCGNISSTPAARTLNPNSCARMPTSLARLPG